MRRGAARFVLSLVVGFATVGIAWAQEGQTGEQRPASDQDAVQEAVRRTSERGNYAFTNNIGMSMMGNDVHVQMNGKFESPDLIRVRVEVELPDMGDQMPPGAEEMNRPTEVIARGDRVRVRREGDPDWMDPEDMMPGQGMRPQGRISDPLRALTNVVEALEGLAQDGEETSENVSCRRYRATLSGDSLRQMLNDSFGGAAEQLDAMVTWEGSTCSVTILVGQEDSLVYKVLQQYDLSSAMAPDMPITLSSDAAFKDHGATHVEIPEELREDLAPSEEAPHDQPQG